MQRLVGFNGVSNFRLLLKRQNISDLKPRVFHSLLNNHRTPILRHGEIFKTTESQYSSISPGMIELLKKKKFRRSKKYTELLQVTQNSSKQTTTTIHKLTAKKLSDFIRETGYKASGKRLQYNKYSVSMLEAPKDSNDVPIVFVGRNVNELNLSNEGIQEILDSYNAYRDSSENPELEAAEPVEEESEVLPEIVAPKATKESKAKGTFKSKYHISFEAEKLSRQKSLAISLSAYLDCCVQNGMLNRGYITLTNYRQKFKKIPSGGIKINDVSLYNMLIHGYAEKENLQKCQELLGILREDQITPNEQSYANYLECLGRMSENPNSLTKNNVASQEELVQMIQSALDEAAEFKITPVSIVDKSIFVKDQREVVIEAIKLVDPEFEQINTPPDLLYNREILESLNVNVQDITINTLENLDTPLPGSEIMNSKRGFTRDQLEALAKEQLKNELAGHVTIKSIQEFPSPTPLVLFYREKMDGLQKNWRETIIQAFHRDLNTLKYQETSKARGNQNLLPYLRALSVEDYADIILREIRYLAEGSETFSPTVSQLYRALGNKVQLLYQTENKKRNGILQKTGKIYGSYCDILAAGNSSDNPRQCWQRLVYHSSNEGPSMNFNEKSWPSAALTGVGRFLYSILMRDLKIDVRLGKSKTENLAPAFYTLFRHQGRMMKEEVKPHPVLVKLYRGSQQENLTFEVNQVPMLCPPQPWSTTRNGGYLLAKSDLIRLPQSARQQIDQIEQTPLPDLYPSLDSLNQLASVAWTVHPELLDVALKVFNTGGNLKLDVPVPPASLPAPPNPPTDVELTKAQKFEFYRQKLVHRRKQSEMYSLWCDSLYRLSLANHYRDKIFWLPHNMDFRGRVYPVPPHLNHLGSDLARSLLVFHQKKKLGVDGFAWLKLHCINLTGLKKRDSVRERLLFADQVMDEIIDSAENPLDGRMWWTKSDEPWQTLGACMEIAKVLKSGDPENFESSFPIHQDGSCNGLQHYAALGRDTAGACSVNLAPADIPQDVYSGVAQLVEQGRIKDENNGVEVARVLRGFVRRKVIKQTVMTTVYGVTRYGARLQIAKQLKDIDDFPKEWVWPASTYLTAKTFDSLREMFTSTKEIQDWFTDCARLISSTCGQNVQWVTPLGLPVVQPYSRVEKFKGDAKNGKLDENFVIDTFGKPNIMKQKNAFPPNFIHSLDSSHMMLTSLNCEKAGLTFISVHDCFWTHACTVPEMNKITREQFVALHQEPILEDLSKYMKHKYSFSKKDFLNDGSVGDMAKRKLNRILTMVPAKGDFDLQNVLKSVYFFS